MGVSYHVYVGAYLEIRADPIKTSGELRCLEHGPVGYGPFCPLCGTKMEGRMKKRPAYLHDLTNCDDLAQLNDEYGPECDIILAVGNLRKELPDHICSTDQSDLIAQHISAHQIGAMKENFRTNYADIIEMLRLVATVSVCFGLITYAA